MENTMYGGQSPSPAYDFRVYDQVWQRVTPGVDPFAPAGDEAAPSPPAPQTAPDTPEPAPVPAAPGAAPAQEGTLPGAERNPCCMGTEAQASVEVLAGFIEEELAGRRCCLALSCRVRSQAAARLLRRIAGEKRAAVRELCGAYYLITGKRYTAAITVAHTQFQTLAQALRSCYHQEACAGFNYRRAADETQDTCLQKLLTRLAAQSYRRAEDVLTLLGKLLC